MLLSAVDRFSDPVFKRMLISVDTILGKKDEARKLAATMENPDEDELLQRQLVLLDVEDPLERIHALAELSAVSAKSLANCRWTQSTSHAALTEQYWRRSRSESTNCSATCLVARSAVRVGDKKFSFGP